jgi:cbb3-type cytochrome oxidase subunit 3
MERGIDMNKLSKGGLTLMLVLCFVLLIDLLNLNIPEGGFAMTIFVIGVILFIFGDEMTERG